MACSDYTQSSRKWTRESVVEAIKAKTVDGYCKSTDVGMSVTTMARRLFGSFHLALEASGAKLWSSKPVLACCSVGGCAKPVRSARSEYCETHYYRLRRNGTLETKVDRGDYKECAYCGAATTNGSKYCSANCRTRHVRGTPLLVGCVVCGSSFRPAYKATCCSAKCNEELSRIRAREWYAKAIKSPEQKQKVRRAEYRRKALKRNAFVEHVDLGVVYKRDKGTCWLCSKPVSLTAKWPDIGFATLDHVVPLVAGGLHCYGNIRLAHLQCNSKKGRKLLVDATPSGMPVPEAGQIALF